MWLQQTLSLVSHTLLHSVLSSFSPSGPSHMYIAVFTLGCQRTHCSLLKHKIFQQETEAHQMAREIK